MRKLIASIAMVVAFATVLAASAPADSGWAGSRYARSDCSHVGSQGRPGLFCERWFSSATQTTQTTLVADEACANGLRAIERRGTLETRFRGFDFYNGPVPLARFNTGGDNVDFIDTWSNFVDTDLGCT